MTTRRYWLRSFSGLRKIAPGFRDIFLFRERTWKRTWWNAVDSKYFRRNTFTQLPSSKIGHFDRKEYRSYQEVFRRDKTLNSGHFDHWMTDFDIDIEREIKRKKANDKRKKRLFFSSLIDEKRERRENY